MQFIRHFLAGDHPALEPTYKKWGTRLIERVYAPEYTDFDKLPESGAAMLICNHVSYADGPIIAAGAKRPVRFVIYEPIYRLPVVHHFMKVNRAIPIYPTRDKVRRALDDIAEGLEAGDLICIFPEGQLTMTGGLGRFRPGIESILQKNPVPVYPMALTGLWGSILSRKHDGKLRRFWPFGNLKMPVRAICGDPINGKDAHVNLLQETVLRLKYKVQ